MRKRGAIVAAWVLVAATLSAAPSAYAAVAGCQPDLPVQGDVDSDEQADLVVGLPGRNNATGEVDVRLTSAPSRVLTRAAAGLGTGAAGDRFGAAVAIADLNDDGCGDLVVGAPGERSGAGRAYVIFGAPDGFQSTGAIILNGGASVGDGFGASVAVAQNLGRTGFDLWVGAPTDDIGGATDAGSITLYSAVESAGDVTVTKVQTVSQDTSGVPGVVETSDRFGAVLTATRQGVLIGDPDEDVGSYRDAGAVTVLGSTDADPAFDVAYSQSQASPRVAGDPQGGDRFGAAVNSFLGMSIVGVPGEDVGSQKDAGMVHTFGVESIEDPEPLPRIAITQDSPGIPGAVEAGDRFGAAVLVAENVCFNDALQAVVGAPGEDVTVNGSPKVDAGTAAVFTVSTGDFCARAVDQNTVLSGVPEAGDHLGATLALGQHSENDPDAADRAFIGVPKEARGSVEGAGIVQSTATGSGADSTGIIVDEARLSSVGYSGGALAGTTYGAVIAAPASDD